MANDRKINYTPRAFPQHVKLGGGLLPDIIESHALWAFLSLAHVEFINTEGQVTYEGEKDRTVSLRRLAESVRIQYGIESLDRLFRPSLIDLAKREAQRCGLVWNPKLTIWLESAGHKLDLIDRDPDKVGTSNRGETLQ